MYSIDAYIFCTFFFPYYCTTFYLFCWSIRTRFRPFCVPVKFIFRIFQFRTIIDEVILRSTSGVRIWRTTFTFSTLIFRVVWIKWWTEFLVALILSMFIKSFFSLLWSSTMTPPWLIKKSLSVALNELSKYE